MGVLPVFVFKTPKFLKVVRFEARFSEGKKQKSKNFLRLIDSWREFSDG